MKIKILTLLLLFALIAIIPVSAKAAGVGEYTGQFETTLVPNVEDDEDVIFKSDTGARLKDAGTFGPAAHFTAGRLLDPQTQQYSVVAYLVEEKGHEPVLFIDSNGDHKISADEKYVMRRNPDDTYVWNVTVMLPIKDGPFKMCPIYVKYLRSYTVEKMTKDDRLLSQSTKVLARGKVDVKGKAVLVEYAYDMNEKNVSPQSGWLGIDANGDGEIDLANLSPEAAKADKETVVFRVGDMYLSTKKADVRKNEIVLREHEAKDYKRHELYLNKDFPDFSFTDFDGKKRNFSEFKGKFVLLDVWGFWCGPCRRSCLIFAKLIVVFSHEIWRSSG